MLRTLSIAAAIALIPASGFATSPNALFQCFKDHASEYARYSDGAPALISVLNLVMTSCPSEYDEFITDCVTPTVTAQSCNLMGGAAAQAAVSLLGH